MKMILKLALAASAVAMSAGVAQAQTAPPGAAPDTGGGLTQNAQVRNGGDTFDRDVQRARDEAVANQRRDSKNNGARNVPAQPDDVVTGAEVRDPKGVVVGHIESVSMSAAVVVAEAGKVEVPLEAFGKNAKGLLIPMSKADFDKAVAEANKQH